MEKYIINNKTVAVLKKNDKTIIYNVDNSEDMSVLINSMNLN